MQDGVAALRRYVELHLGDEWVVWPGGWPGEAEVALVDAVNSIRAYGVNSIRAYGRNGCTDSDVVLAPTGPVTDHHGTAPTRP